MGPLGYDAESPAGKILAYLQRNGEGTVRDLEMLLGISTTAVREHVINLQSRDLLSAKVVRRGPGRPHQVYSLSPKGQNLFPKAYDLLINTLLDELLRIEGQETVQRILDAVGARLAEEYRGQISAQEISARLAELRDALEAKGIPAAIQDDGGLRVLACPYLDVAQEHASVCTMERRMLEQVLGGELTLDRTIRDGHKSCHFALGKPPETPHGVIEIEQSILRHDEGANEQRSGH